MSIRRLLIFVILLGMCGGISFLAYGLGTTITDKNAIEESGEQYMETLKIGDYNTAFTKLDPTFQTQMVSAEGFQNWIESWSFFPAEWNFHDRDVQSGIGSLQGSVTIIDGRRMGVSLELVEVDGAWRVSRMDFLTS